MSAHLKESKARQRRLSPGGRRCHSDLSVGEPLLRAQFQEGQLCPLEHLQAVGTSNHGVGGLVQPGRR